MNRIFRRHPVFILILGFLLGHLSSFYFTSLKKINVDNEKTFVPARTTSIYVEDKTTSIPATTSIRRLRPFDMPIKGERIEIFQPLYDMPHVVFDDDSFLMGRPQAVIGQLANRIKWLNSFVTGTNLPTLTHARVAYFELIKTLVSGAGFGEAEFSIFPKRRVASFDVGPFDPETRKSGKDWTYIGDTMTGWARLNNVRDLLQDVIEKGVEGDYIETGVWRGGASMFARSVIWAFDESEKRKSYVCDSFAGLPPGDRDLAKKDKGWDNTKYLEIPAEIVAQGFHKYNLLDHNVIFAKGFFNETMKPLSQRIEKLAVMRLDGDMYESTVDVLYHLYDKLSIGGYLIMDDWFNFPSKDACEDFFAVHGISPKIITIDSHSIYWQKTKQVKIQYWRYEQNKFQ